LVCFLEGDRGEKRLHGGPSQVSGDGGDGRARLGYYSGLERARKARGRTARATARRRNMEIEVGRWKMLGSVASAHYSADSGSMSLLTLARFSESI
jgi:hypothetical protein